MLLSFINKNQRLFFVHSIMRSFFLAFDIIGWVYLYVQGVPVLHLLIAFLGFRVLEVSFFVPLVFKLIQKIPFKVLFFLGILFQGCTFVSFYFAPQGALFLALTVVLFSLYDAFYYTLRTDLERITPQNEDIGKSMGILSAIGPIMESVGVLATTYVLAIFPQLTFVIAVLGGFVSFIPILFLDLKIVRPPKPQKFFQFLFQQKKLFQWLVHPLVLISFAGAIVSEFVVLFPVFLAHYEITLIQIGWLLASMKIISFVNSLLAGALEDGRKKSLFPWFAVLTAGIFALAFFAPINYWAWLLLAYAVFGIGWELGIRTTIHRFVRKNIEPVFGGVFDMTMDISGRALLCFFLLMIALGTQNIAHTILALFILSIVVIFSTLVFVPKTKRLLVED